MRFPSSRMRDFSKQGALGAFHDARGPNPVPFHLCACVLMYLFSPMNCAVLGGEERGNPLQERPALLPPPAFPKQISRPMGLGRAKRKEKKAQMGGISRARRFVLNFPCKFPFLGPMFLNLHHSSSGGSALSPSAPPFLLLHPRICAHSRAPGGPHALWFPHFSVPTWQEKGRNSAQRVETKRGDINCLHRPSVHLEEDWSEFQRRSNIHPNR